MENGMTLYVDVCNYLYELVDVFAYLWLIGGFFFFFLVIIYDILTYTCPYVT